MKTILLSIAMLTVYSVTSRAQETKPSSNAVGDKSKMEIFKPWAGQWKGEGWIQQGPGEAKTTTVEEFLEFKLDGMILVIEGVGMHAGNKTHHAYAILSYDKLTNGYRFRTYLADGKSADAWLTVLAENEYRWGFDVPSGKIQYTIKLDFNKKTWTETGEFSADGSQWFKFFQMNLQKVK
jgi:hypothetical protein